LTTGSTDQKGGRVLLGGISRVLQRPLRENKEGELLTASLGEESVWPIQCPSNTVDSK